MKSGNQSLINSTNKVPEPYRILFPFGLVSAVCAVSLWILFRYQFLSFYPKDAHANLLFFGFFGAFVSGFLMTAVPKMTGTLRARVTETGFAAFLLFCQICLAFLNEVQAQLIVYLVQIVFLLWFLVSRIWVNKTIPFEGFYFLPFAFIWAFVSFYLYYTQKISMTNFYTFVGEAFLMNLICGLGSRLIPVVARLPNALSPTAKPGERRIKFLAFSLILNTCYFLYLLDYTLLANLLIGIFLFVFSILFLSLHKKPLQIGFLGVSLKICWGLMIFVKVMLSIYPGQSLPLQHIFYIGGMFLITLLIGTRVMLAHAGQDLSYELNGKVVVGTMVCLVASAALRFIAGSDVIGNFISAAFVCFLLANAIWGYKFFNVLTKSRSSSC